jgi:FlaA1/EpsC-like NDP-sugar epimerase/predicted RNA-binding Zn-ribbon protein involved in translation (DUF1610 family)
VFVDVAMVCCSVYLAVALKADDWALRDGRDLAFRAAAFLAPISVIVFWWMRLYVASWRLAEIDDYVRAATACATVVSIALVLCSWVLQDLPASLLVIYGLVSMFMIVGSRASYRVLVSIKRRTGTEGTPVLLYGPNAGDFNEARDLIDQARHLGLRPVGFVTPTGAGRGELLAGLKIWGAPDELPRLTRMAGADTVVIAKHGVREETVRRFQEICIYAHITLYRLHRELQSLAQIDTPVVLAAGAMAAVPMEPVVQPRLVQSMGFLKCPACPKCGAEALRRSRTRSTEMVRRQFTNRRPYRCDECDWRGWIDPTPVVPGEALLPTFNLDLSGLESVQADRVR